MGKSEEEQSLSTTLPAVQGTEQNVQTRCRIGTFTNFRCVLTLLLGFAVLLSAIFWFPFFRLGGRGDLDLDLDSSFRGHDIVASFMIEKPVSLLKDKILQLEGDIFDEFRVPSTKVQIIFLEASARSNITRVLFAVDSDLRNKSLSLFAKSLVRASFVTLVIHEDSLHLTSLCGDPFHFNVLKFTGGITVSPPQRAFLMQKVQILFNFTLNFSIDEIQDSFNELTSQLKSGLHLSLYENLYISLINLKGSTVSSPVIVQSRVLLAVGIKPSSLRFKQLAQTINDSHSKNLGLNNTVFGRVKQVRLSSIPQHSLGGDGSGAPSPSLAPLSYPPPHPNVHHQHHQHHHRRRHDHHHRHHNHHHHHHNHHRHRHRHRYRNSSLSLPMLPAPVPQNSHEANPPSSHFSYRKRFPNKANKHSYAVPPSVAPIVPGNAALLPQIQLNPPAPVMHPAPVSSPLPHVIFSHAHPPSDSESDAEHPDKSPSSPSPSSAGVLSPDIWVILLFRVILLQL